jgi:hypothetical protein
LAGKIRRQQLLLIFPNNQSAAVYQLVIECTVKALLVMLLVRTLQSHVYHAWDHRGTPGGYSGSDWNRPHDTQLQGQPVSDSTRFLYIYISQQSVKDNWSTGHDVCPPGMSISLLKTLKGDIRLKFDAC